MDYAKLIDISLTMTGAGILGGLVNYAQLDHSINCFRGNFLQGNLFRVLILAVAASFLVPVFLQMISSDLVKVSMDEPHNFFVLFGFCLAAAITSRAFIETITKKLLSQIEETNKQVKVVSEQSKQETEELRVVKSQNYLIEGKLQMKEGHLHEALRSFNKAIELNESDRAWGNKALALYYIGKIDEALQATNRALELPPTNKYREAEIRWNRACYLSLLKKDINEIISELKLSIDKNPDVAKHLLTEPDLEYARSQNEFMTAFSDLVKSQS